MKNLALAAGFDLAGVARIAPAGHPDAYRQWIASGQQGEMHYLARQVEERLDLRKKWPWAKSAIVVALAYYQESEDPKPDISAFSIQHSALKSGRIARYAWGRDYHRVMDARLRRLEKLIRERLAPEAFEVRACCDTAPVLERELAARAGLGWVGKNTLLIHPRHGSWFVLGELMTSLELSESRPLPDGRGSDFPDQMTEHCGTCRRCIEACPTGAITPWQVDARKCLSYLTLEHRGAIPAE
ncbi:MAG: tRNA epoxyqueuosine(34) reductase QueG, partial [Phycisphaerae bacterium]